MDLVKAVVKLLGAALLAAGIVCSATAGTIVYDVDTFDDSTLLTTEYDGLILDEFAFPSHSADGVVFDDGGPITNDFSKPVFGVSGYFTYFNGRTIAVDDGATSNPEPSSIALMAGVIAAGLHRCGWLHRS